MSKKQVKNIAKYFVGLTALIQTWGTGLFWLEGDTTDWGYSVWALAAIWVGTYYLWKRR